MFRKRVIPTLMVLAAHAFTGAAVTVSIPDLDVPRGATVDVPIQVQGLAASDSLIAFQAVVVFNSAVIQAVGASTTGTMTQNWGDLTAGIKGDTIRVVGITTNQPGKKWVADDGKLVNLNFFILGDVDNITIVRIDDIKLFGKNGAITMGSIAEGQMTVVKNPVRKTVNIDLNPSWNQISFSLTPNDPDTLPGVLGGAPVVYVKSWVSTGSTKSWDAVRPWFLNDLKRLDGLRGYLLKLNSPTVRALSLTGEPISVSTPFLLYPGWSLISYLPDSGDSLSHALASLGGAYRYVSSFQQSWDRTGPDFLNTLKIMQPSIGYLVKMDSAKVLVYPSSGHKVSKFPAWHIADVTPQRIHSSPKSCDFWACQTDLFIPGDTVRVYDADGVLCGDTLITPQRGFLVHVAGDDPTAPDIDEGALEGDTLLYEIGGKRMREVGTSQSFDTTIVSGRPALWEDMGSKHVRLEEYVNPRPHPPIITGLPDTTLQEDTVLLIPWTWLAARIHDDNDSLSALTLSFTPAPHFTFVMDTAAQALRIIPAADWSGGETIVVRVTDPTGASSQDTTDITVTPVDDAPRPFDLVSPASDGIPVLSGDKIRFSWTESLNVDEKDTIVYRLTIGTNKNDLAGSAIVDLPASITSLDVAPPPAGTYYWSVLATDKQKNSVWANQVNRLKLTTEVEAEKAPLPSRFEVSANYPNPFNPETAFEIQLPRDSRVRVLVFGMRGQVVRSLIDGEQTAGTHRVAWDGRDSAGQSVPSGLYSARIQLGDRTFTRKLTLAK